MKNQCFFCKKQCTDPETVTSCRYKIAFDSYFAGTIGMWDLRNMFPSMSLDALSKAVDRAQYARGIVAVVPILVDAREN